jgi:hypothetical protein
MRRPNLTVDEVRHMTQLRCSGKSLRQIAVMYGCDWTTVSKATNRRNSMWAQWLVHRGAGL